jgi:hypothetical protein
MSSIIEFNQSQGMDAALQEFGLTPSQFVQKLQTSNQLRSNPQGDAVFRKAAALASDMLANCESTRNGKARFILAAMSKTANWLPCHYRILQAAFDPDTMTKQALVGRPDPIDFSSGLFTALLLSGALAGGTAHYLGKQVDEDDVEIEKERAVYNEYLRLADELDRKVTAQALKERGA